MHALACPSHSLNFGGRPADISLLSHRPQSSLPLRSPAARRVICQSFALYFPASSNDSPRSPSHLRHLCVGHDDNRQPCSQPTQTHHQRSSPFPKCPPSRFHPAAFLPAQGRVRVRPRMWLRRVSRGLRAMLHTRYRMRHRVARPSHMLFP